MRPPYQTMSEKRKPGDNEGSTERSWDERTLRPWEKGESQSLVVLFLSHSVRDEGLFPTPGFHNEGFFLIQYWPFFPLGSEWIFAKRTCTFNQHPYQEGEHFSTPFIPCVTTPPLPPKEPLSWLLAAWITSACYWTLYKWRARTRVRQVRH